MNNNDAAKKLKEILSDKNMARLGIQTENIINSGQGEKIAEKFSKSDKEKILNIFMSMDTEEIKKKLKNVNMADLKNFSADDFLKKLR